MGMDQIIPRLWNDGLELKKKYPIWNEKITKVIEKQENTRTEYILSKIEIDDQNNEKITLYDKVGNIKEVNHRRFVDEYTEVFETEEGDKEVKKYDKDNNLISEVWIYPDGDIYEKLFAYENGKLIKIVEKDEFDTLTEALEYEDGRLCKIISIDEEETIVMELKLLYNDLGNVVETHRIQDGEINKKVYYTYNKHNQLLSKEENKDNRLTNKQMCPEIYTYKYFDSGKIKQEKWTIFLDHTMKDKKYESISHYNEHGLEVKTEAFNYEKEWKEITLFEYKYKNSSTFINH